MGPTRHPIRLFAGGLVTTRAHLYRFCVRLRHLSLRPSDNSGRLGAASKLLRSWLLFVKAVRRNKSVPNPPLSYSLVYPLANAVVRCPSVKALHCSSPAATSPAARGRHTVIFDLQPIEPLNYEACASSTTLRTHLTF